MTEPAEPDRSDLERRIVDVISNSKYQWRTVVGIARDAGVDTKTAIDILEQSPKIIRARRPNRFGAVLYSTRERHNKGASLASKLISTITNNAD